MSNPLKSATMTGVIVIAILAIAYFSVHPFPLIAMLRDMMQTMANYIDHLLTAIASHIRFRIH